MEAFQKLQAIGVATTGMMDGLPLLPGRFLKRVDGGLKVYFDRSYRPFDEPEEDLDFPSETLQKIEAILDGETAGLSPEELDALATLEANEQFSSALDTIPEAVWKEFLFEVMKERYKGNPAYLASWIAKVDAAGLSGVLR